MLKHIFSLVIPLLLIGVSTTAQQTFNTDRNIYDEPQGIVYDRETTVDFKLHTNGYALGINFAKLKTYYLTRYINFEIGELKHHKEFRQSFDFQAQASRVSRAFIFGKQNNLLVLRGGIGEKRYFSEKARRKGVAVGVSYSGGPALGLLKPYYLELRSADISNGLMIRSEKYTEDNAATFLDISRIHGSSGFAKGLSELSIRPGVYGKAGVHFDWGAYDEFVKAMEVGIMFDVFLQSMPIMVESPLAENVENRPYFVNFYLNLQLGKRK